MTAVADEVFVKLVNGWLTEAHDVKALVVADLGTVGLHVVVHRLLGTRVAVFNQGAASSNEGTTGQLLNQLGSGRMFSHYLFTLLSIDIVH